MFLVWLFSLLSCTQALTNANHLLQAQELACHSHLWWMMSNHAIMQTCFLVLGVKRVHINREKINFPLKPVLTLMQISFYLWSYTLSNYKIWVMWSIINLYRILPRKHIKNTQGQQWVRSFSYHPCYFNYFTWTALQSITTDLTKLLNECTRQMRNNFKTFNGWIST